MDYTIYKRPMGRKQPVTLELPSELEALFQAVQDHDLSRGFTFEDCGIFDSYCFVAMVDVSDPDQPGEQMEPQDVVVNNVTSSTSEANPAMVWEGVIERAADYLGINKEEIYAGAQ